MVTLNAHFDGKVIVPDEPLALKPNQKVRISVEPIEAPAKVDFSRLLGLAATPNQKPYDPAEEDALWEGTTGNYLENGPNKPSMKNPAERKPVE